jgi:hypothetical protein
MSIYEIEQQEYKYELLRTKNNNYNFKYENIC